MSKLTKAADKLVLIIEKQILKPCYHGRFDDCSGCSLYDGVCQTVAALRTYKRARGRKPTNLQKQGGEVI